MRYVGTPLYIVSVLFHTLHIISETAERLTVKNI